VSVSDYKPNTVEENRQAYADLMPSGITFDKKNVSGTNIYKLLLSISKEMVRYQNDLYSVIKDYIPKLNGETNGFIDEWENFVGIPDDCFEEGIYTDEERIRNIIIKLAYMNLQTDADYYALANLLGITIEITPATDFGLFTLTFPFIFGNGYTAIITFLGPSFNSFPFTFPILFDKNPYTLFQCIVEKQKPAYSEVIFKNKIV